LAAAALFDAYVMVDWSAAAVPRLGRDSIWIHELRRRGDALSETLSINLPTRAEARERLRDLLAGHLSAGLATLVGFDFPFGYPHGFAARLGLGGPAWRGVWELLAARIRDEADNRNNRFAVAAKLNREISGGSAPFWGCPAAAAGEFLQPTHHRSHGALDLAEKRLAEARIKGPQPVWKLVGAGAVGSQALTGIPVVHWLRRHPSLAEACAVWPFETGLAVPHPPPRPRIILAEVYPSLVRPVLRDGEVKDAAQLRTIARHFATLDAAGRLAAQFAGPPDLSAEDRARIEAEEGWILGVPREEPPAATRQAPPPRYASSVTGAFPALRKNSAPPAPPPPSSCGGPGLPVPSSPSAMRRPPSSICSRWWHPARRGRRWSSAFPSASSAPPRPRRRWRKIPSALPSSRCGAGAAAARWRRRR
jgi:precorrin-8X/cobalt-precorrin-8 methylmutase